MGTPSGPSGTASLSFGADMATIVEKLQQAALDRHTPVNDLLRRVKFVATKLGLINVEEWVDHELNGYHTSPPDYRRVHGVPIAVNPYRGPMPISGYIEGLSWKQVRDPVSALEALVASTASGGTLHMGYSDKVREKLDRVVTAALDPLCGYGIAAMDQPKVPLPHCSDNCRSGSPSIHHSCET